MPTSHPTPIAGWSTRGVIPRWSPKRFGLGPDSLVVELASNDGYLLQHFLPLGVPVLGIEPAANVARAAVAKGIPTLVEFFSTASAKRMLDQGTRADLLIGNNVLAQVPDLNDFVAGTKLLLKRRWGDHDGVSAPPRADPPEPVRHDLSRALLVLLVPRRRNASSPGTVSCSSTLRSCPRTADR